jgi:ketosteroid isomerase-like protein
VESGTEPDRAGLDRENGMRTTVAAVLVFVSCAGLTCSRATIDRDLERKRIAEVVSSCIGWAKDKKLEVLFGAIANDDDYVSVSPRRRVVRSFEDVKESVPFWMSPDFKYVRHELRDLEITFSRSGDVAWFYCVLDDINTYKGQPACWENTRWTGVVEKRSGRWVIVQQHFSFAVDE